MSVKYQIISILNEYNLPDVAVYVIPDGTVYETD